MGFHHWEPQEEHPVSQQSTPHEEGPQESLVVQQVGVDEQHPLAIPQAASSISFVRREDRRRFIVTSCPHMRCREV